MGLTAIAPAATIHTSVEVDLVNGFRTVDYGSFKYFNPKDYYFVLDTPFWSGSGDKIILDITFADNKALKIYNSDHQYGETYYAGLEGANQGGYSATCSGHTEFLGVNGSCSEEEYIYTTNPYPQVGHILRVFGGNTTLTDSWFSLTGMRVEIDVLSILNGDSSQSYETQSYFDRLVLQFGGGDFEVISAAVPTPVPGAMTLLGAGILGLAGIKRKNR